MVGLGNMLQAVAVAVEIVVYDRGTRLLALGNVRQQPRTAEEVDKHRVLWVLL